MSRHLPLADNPTISTEKYIVNAKTGLCFILKSLLTSLVWQNPAVTPDCRVPDQITARGTIMVLGDLNQRFQMTD